MLAVQLPVSFFPNSRQSPRIMKESLPPLPQLRDFEQNWASKSCGAIGRVTRHTPFESQPGNIAAIRHGLRTPPSEMNETNGNPLLAPNCGPLQYKGVPVVAPNNASQQNHLSSLGSLRYTSRVPPPLDTHHLVKGSQSPRSSTGQSANRDHSHRRGNSEGTDIVHYLQIPRSINDSKGSLAEFAAQVRLRLTALPM